MLECIMHHVFSNSDSYLYWYLAYICESIFDLRIYVTVRSPYPRDQGVTGWYQSLGSYIFSTSRWQINGKKICNWNAWIPVIQPNYKYKVIYSFFIVLSLIPESFSSSRFLFPYLYTKDMNKLESSSRVLNEAIIWSIRLTLWSSGILKIDLRSGYLLEVRIWVSQQLFYILGYIFQSDRHPVFGILNYRSSLLCSVLSGFSLSLVFW